MPQTAAALSSPETCKSSQCCTFRGLSVNIFVRTIDFVWSGRWVSIDSAMGFRSLRRASGPEIGDAGARRVVELSGGSRSERQRPASAAKPRLTTRDLLTCGGRWAANIKNWISPRGRRRYLKFRRHQFGNVSPELSRFVIIAFPMSSSSSKCGSRPARILRSCRTDAAM